MRRCVVIHALVAIGAGPLVSHVVTSWLRYAEDVDGIGEERGDTMVTASRHYAILRAAWRVGSRERLRIYNGDSELLVGWNTMFYGIDEHYADIEHYGERRYGITAHCQ